MSDINTLLGLGLGPEDDMQALADNLRGQQREGRFLGMSTVAPIAQYGQGLQLSATDSAKQGGALRLSMAKEAQAQANYNSTALAKTQAAKLANQNQVASDALDFENSQITAENLAASQAAAAARVAEANAAKRETASYWHPTKPNTVLNLREGPDGQHYDQGDPSKVYNPQLLTPYKAPTVGGSQQNLRPSKFQEQKESLTEKRLQNKDFISRSMTSPYFAGAVGSKADIAKHGPEWLGINPQTGSLQTDLNSMTVEQAAEPLSYLGVNPTDADLKFALDAVRKLGSSPESWRNWYAGVYNDDIKRAIMNSKDLSNEEKVQALSEWDGQVADVLEQMDYNIKLESGKSAKQRFKESTNETYVITYRDAVKRPEDVTQERWDSYTFEQKSGINKMKAKKADDAKKANGG